MVWATHKSPAHTGAHMGVVQAGWLRSGSTRAHAVGSYSSIA
jgi:hypothetical protein